MIRNQRNTTDGRTGIRHLWHRRSTFNSGILLLMGMLMFSQRTEAKFKGGASSPLLEACARPEAGAAAQQPAELRSENGKLSVTLTIRNSPDANGNMRYCYLDERGNQAPTLRVKPGDILTVVLKNELSLGEHGSPNQAGHQAENDKRRRDDRNPCGGGPMTAASANLHFHGLSVPPVCHQDETLKTVIQPGDPPFEYRIQIPKTQPPGLYWYHPHVHGFGEVQLLGGASGALIVDSLEGAVPRASGLPEQVFIIRDEEMPAATSTDKPDPMRPTKQLTINYVPVPYPKYPPAVIEMKPGERQLWRVLNASADTYLNLSLEFAGKKQLLNLVALDGVPLHFGQPGWPSYSPQQSSIFMPPGTRAEFIVTGPPEGMTARLVTGYVFRGADEDGKPLGQLAGDSAALRTGQDDVDAARPLAAIVTRTGSAVVPPVEPEAALAEPPGVPLSAVRPVRKRKFYFSEKVVDPNNPKSATLFFITEDGHTPAVFDPTSNEPNVTVHQGDVEDWTIENRSRESHVFHIHQMHFIVVNRSRTRWEEATLRDTVDVPAWDGMQAYPSVTVRLDFRDPEIVGTIPFHCHILQHLDGGMMGTVRIEPASPASKSDSERPH